MPNKIAILYIPVLHRGYEDFFQVCAEKGVEQIYIVGDDILEANNELDYINRKDRLRAVPVMKMQKVLSSLIDIPIDILTTELLESLQKSEVSVLAPKEDIGTFLVGKYFAGNEIEYVDIFLRWNKENIGENKEPETESVKISDFQKNVFGSVLAEASKSFDWWRQVGAALVKDGEVVCVTHNEHMPEKQQPNIDGDTRALFKKGININYVTSAHAEVAAIGEAARAGIKTEGAELFVTDFPCPYCARLIAKAGIKKVYFLKGYAVLDGDDFLKEEGVEVVKVLV